MKGPQNGAQGLSGPHADDDDHDYERHGNSRGVSDDELSHDSPPPEHAKYPHARH
ncbi:hypothetical protein SEA_WELCOME_118 [Microbacterium phage Welcome]|nr:hypothetical protein SEA_WELCOME_1 [Microbacterium phage Welcome]QYC54235.1 hypothetical protein SEA_WELCOME_118 [Microbacterium phage Welcome]